MRAVEDGLSMIEVLPRDEQGALLVVDFWLGQAGIGEALKNTFQKHGVTTVHYRARVMRGEDKTLKGKKIIREW